MMVSLFPPWLSMGRPSFPRFAKWRLSHEFAFGVSFFWLKERCIRSTSSDLGSFGMP